jgi:hypothetical protein
MNEARWLGCQDPDTMVDHLCRRRKATRLKDGRRRLRLFACACCRHFWDLLADGRSRRAIEVSERHADGQAGKEELERARSAAEAAQALPSGGEVGPAARASWIAAGAAADAAQSWPVEVVVRLVLSKTGLAARAASGEGASASPAGLAALHDLYRRQCGLLRCLFGNPFRPLPRRPFPAHVVGLARACYDAFPAVSADYAVLADALDDLGEQAAAAHCREATHARGCHVVDWARGKG